MYLLIHLPVLLLAFSCWIPDSSRRFSRLEQSPSRSAVERAAIFNHKCPSVDGSSPSCPIFLSSNPRSVCYEGGGVPIFHATSKHHIDRLSSCPVGGQLEHAALANVLFQVRASESTFVFSSVI